MDISGFSLGVATALTVVTSPGVFPKGLTESNSYYYGLTNAYEIYNISAANKNRGFSEDKDFDARHVLTWPRKRVKLRIRKIYKPAPKFDFDEEVEEL